VSTIACARAQASSTSLNVGGGAPWPLLTLAHAALASYSEKIFVKRACGRAIVASMGVLRLRCILCSRSVGQRPVPLSAKAGRETVESYFRRIRALRRRSRSAARSVRGSSSMSPTSRPSKGRGGFGDFGPGGRSAKSRRNRTHSLPIGLERRARSADRRDPIRTERPSRQSGL
jgi:hypothetical protein